MKTGSFEEIALFVVVADAVVIDVAIVVVTIVVVVVAAATAAVEEDEERGVFGVEGIEGNSLFSLTLKEGVRISAGFSSEMVALFLKSHQGTTTSSISYVGRRARLLIELELLFELELDRAGVAGEEGIEVEGGEAEEESRLGGRV